MRKPIGNPMVAFGASPLEQFRRLVAKCLSLQFISDVEKVCATYQFAMSTRAGTDCVGTDHNPRATVLLMGLKHTTTC